MRKTYLVSYLSRSFPIRGHFLYLRDQGFLFFVAGDFQVLVFAGRGAEGELEKAVTPTACNTCNRRYTLSKRYSFTSLQLSQSNLSRFGDSLTHSWL